MKKLMLVIFSVLVFSWTAFGQDEPTKGTFSIVTNPSYFVLGGYHIKPAYHFPKKWSVSSTLQGGFVLPDFARDQFFEHNNNDLSVDWTYAISVGLKYRFTDAPYDKGFFTAVNVGYEGWELMADNSQTAFTNWFASLDVGYHWFPFKKERLHLGVSYSLIFILNNTDTQTIGDTNYNIRPIVPPSFTPSVFIGWRF